MSGDLETVETIDQRRSGVSSIVSVLLVLVFLFVHLFMFFGRALVGTSLAEILSNQVILSMALSPMIALAVISGRKQLPDRSKDLVGAMLLAMVLLVVLVRLFNYDIDTGFIGFVGVIVGIAASMMIVVLPAIGIIDLFRFKSARLLAITLVLFAALSVNMPNVGFSIAQPCLDEHRVSVLNSVQAEGDSQFSNNPDNAGPGRCGTIAWDRTLFDQDSNTVNLPAAGGALAQAGIVWGDNIQSCRDTGVHLCRDLRSLGDGWFMYSRMTGAN